MNEFELRLHKDYFYRSYEYYIDGIALSDKFSKADALPTRMCVTPLLGIKPLHYPEKIIIKFLLGKEITAQDFYDIHERIRNHKKLSPEEKKRFIEYNMNFFNKDKSLYASSCCGGDCGRLNITSIRHDEKEDIYEWYFEKSWMTGESQTFRFEGNAYRHELTSYSIEKKGGIRPKTKRLFSKFQKILKKYKTWKFIYQYTWEETQGPNHFIEVKGDKKNFDPRFIFEKEDFDDLVNIGVLKEVNKIEETGHCRIEYQLEKTDLLN